MSQLVSALRCNFARLVLVLLAATLVTASPRAQNAPPQNPAGDAPINPGPFATDLSPALQPAAIGKAMRKVGDWELRHARESFSQDWTFAALYRGYLAAAESLRDKRYRDAMLAVGQKFDWRTGPRRTHADDQAIAFLYLELDRQFHDPAMLAPTQAQFDGLMQTPAVCTESCPAGHDATTPIWWWCDALFMAPPVLADLSAITGNAAYLDYLDRNWWITSTLLYDPEEHLFSRDASFLNRREANGKRIFWSRGNGWVIAGLALVLDRMPSGYPSRPRYVEQFRQMAARLAQIQSPDGLWRPGLLDPDNYPLPEVSGSAFFVYALAWGIDRGLLDRAAYLPVVRKGWAGLVEHIYADGRLGSIQPVGAAPGDYEPQSSYVFGVGAFLMAGSEVRRLDAHNP